jgi:4-amino-4-deoxy-L-arabinose transferase-like glycosyltransferase
VLLVGGLLRAAFLLRAPVFIIPDSENYFLPGYQLASGLGFGLEARRTPVYPLFIAAVIGGLGRDLATLALAQHLLGLATAGLTFWIARLAFGRLAALLAGLMVALNGSLLISEHTVGTETLFILLLTLAGGVGVLALQRQQGPLMLLAGALLGFAALARPAGLGLLPALPLVLLALRPGWRTFGRLAALYLTGFALVLLPWMARNYLTLRVFSTEGAFGQTLVGRTVRHDGFDFVNPNRPAGSLDDRERARELMQEAAERGSFITPLRRRLMREYGLSELETNRLMRDLAVEAIVRQPDYFLLGTSRFFVQLAIGWPERVREAWQSRRDAESREEWEAHPEIASLLGPPSLLHERQLPQAERLATIFQPGRLGLPLLALCAVGLLATGLGGRGASSRPGELQVNRQVRLPALLLALWAIGLILVGVAFVGPVLRYRYPAEPFLAVLAGGGLTVLIRAVISLRGRRPLTAA